MLLSDIQSAYNQKKYKMVHSVLEPKLKLFVEIALHWDMQNG